MSNFCSTENVEKSNIYIAVTDISDEDVEWAFETIRICYGLVDVYQYKSFIQNVNNNSNFQHEVIYREIPENVENAKYIAIAYSCYYDNKYSPYIETARLFKDVESAKNYILTLNHKFGAIIEIKKLVWDYENYICDDDSLYLFPKAIDINKDAIRVNIQKSKKRINSPPSSAAPPAIENAALSGSPQNAEGTLKRRRIYRLKKT